jgi:hypothetical protein
LSRVSTNSSSAENNTLSNDIDPVDNEDACAMAKPTTASIYEADGVENDPPMIADFSLLRDATSNDEKDPPSLARKRLTVHDTNAIIEMKLLSLTHSSIVNMWDKRYRRDKSPLVRDL